MVEFGLSAVLPPARDPGFRGVLPVRARVSLGRTPTSRGSKQPLVPGCGPLVWFLSSGSGVLATVPGELLEKRLFL